MLAKSQDDRRLPSAGVWPDPLGRAGRGRVAPAEGGLRAVHQRVLASFATTGAEPGAAELAEAAAPFGVEFERIMAELHAGDFLRLDDAGRVRVAYPFSAVPTPHVVRISGGPQVYAMCAIDALGIAAMLRIEVTVASVDPGTGQAITVTVAADGHTAAWHPGGAVAFAGQESACGSCPDSAVEARAGSVAADVCCGYNNFFASRTSATTWAEAYPEVTGKVLEQAAATRLGQQIFGSLLNTADETAPRSWRV